MTAVGLIIVFGEIIIEQEANSSKICRLIRKDAKNEAQQSATVRCSVKPAPNTPLGGMIPHSRQAAPGSHNNSLPHYAMFTSKTRGQQLTISSRLIALYAPGSRLHILTQFCMARQGPAGS